jgi:hypothetical protein
MKKLLLIIAGLSVLVFGAYYYGNSYQKSQITTSVPSSVPTERPKTSEEMLTVKDGDKKVFNELGWKLYVNQFKKPEPENEKECFKDMTTCDYWEEIAKQYRVRVEDVKFTLYEAGSIALDKDKQKLYDHFHLGLNEIQNKTEAEADKYFEFFRKRYNLEDYELRAIIAKGDL